MQKQVPYQIRRFIQTQPHKTDSAYLDIYLQVLNFENVSVKFGQPEQTKYGYKIKSVQIGLLDYNSKQTLLQKWKYHNIKLDKRFKLKLVNKPQHKVFKRVMKLYKIVAKKLTTIKQLAIRKQVPQFWKHYQLIKASFNQSKNKQGGWFQFQFTQISKSILSLSLGKQGKQQDDSSSSSQQQNQSNIKLSKLSKQSLTSVASSPPFELFLVNKRHNKFGQQSSKIVTQLTVSRRLHVNKQNMLQFYLTQHYESLHQDNLQQAIVEFNGENVSYPSFFNSVLIRQLQNQKSVLKQYSSREMRLEQ